MNNNSIPEEMQGNQCRARHERRFACRRGLSIVQFLVENSFAQFAVFDEVEEEIIGARVLQEGTRVGR